MFEVPETDTSMRLYDQDIQKIRQLVGQSDAHRIHIAVSKLETRIEGTPVDDTKSIIPMNSADKRVITEFPGETQADQFHSFVYTIWRTGLHEKIMDPRAINS